LYRSKLVVHAIAAAAVHYKANGSQHSYDGNGNASKHDTIRASGSLQPTQRDAPPWQLIS